LRHGTNRSLALIGAVLLTGCGSQSRHDWPFPNGNGASTRAAAGSSIDASSVGRLRVAWRFRFTIAPRESGVATATPVVSHGVVFMQDMESNVFALRASDGHLLWRRLFNAGTPGPNGLSVSAGAVFGSTDETVFSLAASDGRLRWSRRILRPVDSYVDVAPFQADGVVVTATTGYGPGTRPSIYGLDADTGAVRWRFNTIRDPWPHPARAGGGGVWQTPSVADGVIYAGTANPLPWGGSRQLPNGGAFAGPALYTDSLVALRLDNGKLRWFDQVTPHDVRDHDFQNSPIVTRDLVIGSGKAGHVIAWDRATHRRRWDATVGLHRNDRGALPARAVPVCPGLLGGIETPGAVADGRVFVAAVDLCYRENATGAAAASFALTDPAAGRGEVVALDLRTGSRLWSVALASPPFGCTTVANDVVFVPTYDGRIVGLDTADGRVVWRARMHAGINACPSVAGDTLYVAAGTRASSVTHPRFELTAYRLR
jgi:outer membrane protein assembly factor BamB